MTPTTSDVLCEASATVPPQQAVQARLKVVNQLHLRDQLKFSVALMQQGHKEGEAEAIKHARDAIEEAIAARMSPRCDRPDQRR